jgi:hypothetical protein
LVSDELSVILPMMAHGGRSLKSLDGPERPSWMSIKVNGGVTYEPRSRPWR